MAPVLEAVLTMVTPPSPASSDDFSSWNKTQTSKLTGSLWQKKVGRGGVAIGRVALSSSTTH